MITSFEFHSTALAIATDWRWPPDSDATGWRTDRTVVTARLASVSPAARSIVLLVEGEVPHRLAAEEHVLDDVEVVAEREVLVDGLDPERGRVPRRADVHRVALAADLAGVGVWMPGDALDQHRLAGAVVAGQRGDLAGGDVEVDVDERVHGAEVLPDALGAGAAGCARRRRPTSLCAAVSVLTIDSSPAHRSQCIVVAGGRGARSSSTAPQRRLLDPAAGTAWPRR